MPRFAPAPHAHEDRNTHRGGVVRGVLWNYWLGYSAPRYWRHYPRRCLELVLSIAALALFGLIINGLSTP